MASSRKSKSSDLPGHAAAALAPHVPIGSSILVGLSGGVDSVVLLHILAGLATPRSWKISALHVHHGISPNADAWADFCARLCAALAVPLQVERVNISPLRSMGIEAAARKLRHEALARQPADFIALAHHQDDQAETLLLQLLRGAGVKGVAAMPFIKRTTRLGPSSQPSDEAINHSTWLSNNDGHVAGYRARGEGGEPRSPVLLRPLLDISRAELEAYARAHALAWIEDESNADESYPRNFLRRRVLPLMEEQFPSSRVALARAASHFAEAGALLDALADLDAQGAFDGETLAVARLGELDGARAKNLLRWFFHRCGALMPETARLEEMLRQLCSARADAQVCIAWGDWEVRRYRGRAHVCLARAEPDADLLVPWSGEENLVLPGGVLHFAHCNGEGMSAKKLAAVPVTVRFRQGEETLRPDAARPARSLRYLFQEHGIPPWQRGAWPLLYCGEALAAVPGIGVDQAFCALPGEASVDLRWDRGRNSC